MDMKRILQTLDSASSKPVEGSDSMKKFLSVVTEGANPHKVTLPVQMAMQHYQKEEVKPGNPVLSRASTLQKYFHEAEQEVIAEQTAEKEHKQQLLRQYAGVIAERVMMKESKQDTVIVSAKRAAIKDLMDKDIYANHEDDEFKDINDHKKSKFVSEKVKNKKVKEVGPGLQSNAPDGGHLALSELSTEKLAQYKKTSYADAKKADSEGDYARGDKRFKGINKATTKQFDNDLKKHDQSPIKEANAKKRTLKNSNPCWKGYHPVGTKKKGGRTVPNCVPKE